MIFNFIIQGIIAVIIAVSFGVIHEYLHRRKAIQLGCNVTKGPRFKNETIVDTTDPIKVKQIARAPYIVIVPIALVILGIGIYLVHLGLMAGGGATLLIHAITYPLEGREERKV